MAEHHHQKSHAAQRRARYREIAHILWDERLFELVRGAKLEDELQAGVDQTTPISVSGQADAKEKDLPLEVRVRHALERLGPVFIKAGQLLATRSDLLPPSFIDELGKLQDDVPAVPFPEMKDRVEAELGAPLETLYSRFDEEPLGAASIGQVYRAALPDGTPVAVKVQRPGVTAIMALDLEILQDLAARLDKHAQWAKDANVVGVADEFTAVLRAELDYLHEARAMDRFRAAFADDAEILFPQVYWDHTTGLVLTMELVQGVPASHLDGTEGTGIDRAKLVLEGVDAYFRMIFELGYYHADPHAGNLFAIPDGRLGFVDFGRTATVSQRNRDSTFDVLLDIFDDNANGITESLLTMTGVPQQLDVADLEIDVANMLALYEREQSTGGSVEKLMQALLRLMRKHRLQVPPELTWLLVTIGVLDGVATQIDANFRMIDAAKPFAKRLVPEKFGPEAVYRASLRSARAYGRFFGDLPIYATRVLRRAGEGEFKVAVRPTEFESILGRLAAAFYMLAYALIIGALIIGFSILAATDLGRVESIIVRAVLGLAVASLAWFLIRFVRNWWRARKDRKNVRRYSR